MKEENQDTLRPVTSKYLRAFLLSLLVLAGVGALGVAIIGGFPKTVVSINPYSDAAATLFATIFIFLCLAGIVCIFKKSIRRTVLIIACVGGISVLIFACFNLFLERLSYMTAKDKEPVERLCVITYHKHHHSEFVTTTEKENVFGSKYEVEERSTVDKYNMYFRFLDDGKEESISGDYPFEYYNQLYEGDTCIAYVREGAFGIYFITNMKCVKRYIKPAEPEEETEEVTEDENINENE